MRRNGTILTLLAVLLFATAAQAQRTDAGKPLTVFESGEYAFDCRKIVAESKLDFVDRERDQSIALEAAVVVPEKVEAVAVLGKCEVLAVTDAKRRDLRKSSRRRSTRSDDYKPVLGRSAETEIDEIKLIANPFLIETMKVQTSVIIAKRREDAEQNVKLAQRLADIGHGIQAQITEIKAKGREIQVSIRFARSKGTAAPFIDRIEALDERGKPVGGGRWTKGNPFDDKDTLTFEFLLDEISDIEAIRYDIVTRNEIENVQFELSEVFQQ